MKNRIPAIAVACVVAAFLAGCAARGTIGVVSEPEGAEKSVLIASQGSRFKGLVVDRVSSELLDRGIAVRAIPLVRLRDVDATRYDAVLLVNTVTRWSLNHRVTRFLDEYPDRNRVVILSTAGDPEWRAGIPDAITSASGPENAGAVANDLVARIDRILETRIRDEKVENPSRTP
ncbi:MAG: hypothetical protein ACLFOY_15210 [Desulfatibacillaceae bacterium]